MPESVTDRCTKAHEYIFLLSKSQKYYYDMNAIKEQSTTNESRPHGIVRNREYGYDSKENALRQKSQTIKRNNSKHNTPIPNQKYASHRADREDDNYDITMRNKRSVWTVATSPYKGAHFAVFPPELIEPCILAGAPAGGIVLDPFFGSGTTGEVAQRLGRNYVGCELNEAYKPLQKQRTQQPSLVLECV